MERPELKAGGRVGENLGEECSRCMSEFRELLFFFGLYWILAFVLQKMGSC